MAFLFYCILVERKIGAKRNLLHGRAHFLAVVGGCLISRWPDSATWVPSIEVRTRAARRRELKI